jgi:general secretion pathway protein L
MAAADRRRAAEGADAARLALALRESRPRAAAILAALSEALPDQAWLTALEIDGEGVEITGYADDAAALPPALDAAPAFGAPRFLTPTTRDAAGARERFALGFALSGDGP